MFGSKTRDFEKLVQTYSTELYRYAYWLARDRYLAEDLVQETFARAWSAWGKLRDERAVRGWLYTILRHEHARLFERKRIDVVEDLDLDAFEDRSLRSVCPDLEMREALHQLPEGYREPLLLQVLGGFTCEEIAEIMKTSPGAVMTRLSRARLALKKIVSHPDSKESHA